MTGIALNIEILEALEHASLQMESEHEIPIPIQSMCMIYGRYLIACLQM
jgi:hypothetical protein